MKVIRINEFKAKAGQVDALVRQLKISVPKIKSSPGCLSCRVLQHQDDVKRLTIIEEWVDEASHEAAVKAIPLPVLQETMKLVAEPPYGENYQEMQM